MALADLHEKEGSFKDAANMLRAMPLENGQRLRLVPLF